jgi:hypothetical protein
MNQNFLINQALLHSDNSANRLNHHHIQGLFYFHFKLNYEGQYKKQWIHNQVLKEEILALSQELEINQIKGTLLKGAHLLQNIYPDLGSRFLSDIDILIDNKNYEAWELVLRKLGFAPVDIPTFRGNNFKSQWVKIVGQVEVNLELHTKLFFHLKQENWNFENSTYNSFTHLSLEDTFIHLCGHLAFQHSFLKLYWLYDIYFYLEKFGNNMNWELIEKKSKEMHLQQSVRMCLWTLYKYFHLDDLLIEKFNLKRSEWWQKYLSLDFLINADSDKKNYYLIKHATKDHFLEAIYYDLSWLWHYKIQKLWS